MRRRSGLWAEMAPPVPATCPSVTVSPEIVTSSPPLSIVNTRTASLPETASVPAPGPRMSRPSPAAIGKAPPVSVMVPLTVLANVIVSTSVSGSALARVIASRSVQLASHASGAPSEVRVTVYDVACAAGASAAPAVIAAPAASAVRSFSSALRRLARSRRTCARCIERADKGGTPGMEGDDGGGASLSARAAGRQPRARRDGRGAVLAEFRRWRRARSRSYGSGTPAAATSACWPTAAPAA